MDRFEGRVKNDERIFIQIYIPVWIDLKRRGRHNWQQVYNIYIPVWIDLKASPAILYPTNYKFTFQYG